MSPSLAATLWQFVGFSAITYLAALSSIDPTLHQAAIGLFKSVTGLILIALANQFTKRLGATTLW